MLSFVVRLLDVLIVWSLIRCISITAISLVMASVCFHCDRLVRREFLKIELLTCDQVLISILSKLFFKLISFDTRLVAILANVLNMLESLLTQKLFF